MAISSVTSAADVCSLALALLRAAPVVSLETPASEGEKRCALVYHLLRKRLLRALPWNFAIKRVVLSASTTTPEFGFTHQYPLPNDFVRFLARYDVSGFRLRSIESEYELENGFLLLNGDSSGQVQIRYIYDHQNVPAWDPMFVDLLAYDIAIHIGPNLSVSGAELDRLKADRQQLRATAGAIDGQERPPKRIQRSKFLEARRQGPGVAGQFIDFGR